MSVFKPIVQCVLQFSIFAVWILEGVKSEQLMFRVKRRETHEHGNLKHMQ
jgi:hypothetical protein